MGPATIVTNGFLLRGPFFNGRINTGGHYINHPFEGIKVDANVW